MLLQSQFKSDFESKGKEIETLRSSFEEETMQLKEKYAEKEVFALIRSLQ